MNGFRTKRKSNLAKQMQDKMSTVDAVDRKTKQIAGQVASDLKLLESRINQLNELVQSVLYVLEGKLDPPPADGSDPLPPVLTRDMIARAHKELSVIWAEERLASGKARMQVGDLLCTKCFFFAPEMSFLKKHPEGRICPRCKHSNFFKKESQDDLLPEPPRETGSSEPVVAGSEDAHGSTEVEQSVR